MKRAKARAYVYSDSVLCLGKTHEPEDAIKRWEEQVSTLEMYHTFRELQGLDGEPIDFEWKNFAGATALDLLLIIQKDLEGKRITPENFSDRIIFMSTFNDFELDKKGMKIRALPLREESKSTPQDSMTDTGHSWDPEREASGIKDMQSIVAATRIVVLHKWWKNTRIQDTQYSKG